jgi:nucleotide-binding universal stress UspA family protein
LLGIVGQALERYVDENDVDLVVMSTHGRGGMNRMWLGSVAEDVIRHGRTPVLLVRPDEDTPGNLDEDIPVQRILVPLQTSEFSENIVPHADQLAEVFGASVQLLEVVVPVELPVRAISAPMTNVDQADLTTRQDSAREFLAGVETRLRGSGRQVESLVSTAPHVAHAIVKAADENDAGIIAMATHARVGIGRMLLGSVADKVVRSATKPVMLFRPGQL